MRIDRGGHRSGDSWKREGGGVGEDGFQRRGGRERLGPGGGGKRANEGLKGCRWSFFQRGLKERVFERVEGLRGPKRRSAQRELEVEGVREGFQREGGLHSGEGGLQLRLKTPFTKVWDPSRREEDRS